MATQSNRRDRMILRAYKQEIARARRSGKKAAKAWLTSPDTRRKAAAWAKRKRRQALATRLIAGGLCLLLAAWALLGKMEPGLQALLLWCKRHRAHFLPDQVLTGLAPGSGVMS